MSATIESKMKARPSRNRRAPAGGYDYPSKSVFRRWVWDRIGGLDEATGETHTGDVLLMPSIEAHEITDEALPRGFQIEQLHVADTNPAIVATLQRRFPGLKTYGCLVDDACRRISARGIKLRAANIDYCSQLSWEILRSIRSISNSPACQDAQLFITILRGREEKFLQSVVACRTGVTGWDAYLERNLESAFLENKDGMFWDNTTGITPTKADLWRIRAIHKFAERRWAQGRAYVSINNQSFLTLWLLPKTEPEPIISEEERNQTDALRCMSLGEDPGDPLPQKHPRERSRDYRARLDSRQRLRLHLIAERMGISEDSVVNRHIPESTPQS